MALQLSPSFFPTVMPSSLPSNSPSIVKKTVVVPASLSFSTDICGLSEKQQVLLASVTRKAIQEITCDDVVSCSANIVSVCGNTNVDGNDLISLINSRGLQETSSWQIDYEVTFVFTCQNAKCSSSKDKAMGSSTVTTISDRVTSALATGNFAVILGNYIKSETSNLEFISTTCLVVWGVIDAPATDEENILKGTGIYYPDWVGGSGTCLQDDQPPLYMQMNPSYWMYNSLEDCCDRYFAGWNKNKCMNQQGSGLWYANFALGRCVIDCAEVGGPLCGGLTTSTDGDLFTDPLTCRESKLPWLKNKSCEVSA